MRRYVRVLAVLLVVLGASMFGPSAVSPAEALACPPQSSLCNPVGLAILAESDAMAGGSSAAVSLAVNTAATGGVAAAGVGLYGWKDGWFQSEAGVLTVVTSPAGFADGVNSFVSPIYRKWGDWRFDGGGAVLVAVTAPSVGTEGTVAVFLSMVGYPEGTDYVNVSYRFVQDSGACNTFSGGGGYVSGQSFSITVGTGCVWHLELGPDTVGAVKFYPVGHVLRPAQGAAGEGVVTRKISCEDASGVVKDFTDSTPGTAATRFALPALTCPSGSVLVAYSSSWTPTGGATQTIIPETESAIPSIPNEYPLCLVPGACVVALFQVHPDGVTSCGSLAVACPEWYSDPQRSDNYECRWGPYSVALSYCSTMRTPGEVRPNTRLNPDGSQTVVEWPSAEPDPQIDGDTYTGTGPGTGIGPSGEPGPTDSTGSECFPRGWGALNPAEWVLKPVGCALVWAFVPAGGIDTTGIRSAFDDSPFGQGGDLLLPIIAPFGTLSDGVCGPLVNYSPDLFQGQAFVISTCDEPWTTVGPVMRTLIGIGMWIAAVWFGVRSILKGLGLDVIAGGDNGGPVDIGTVSQTSRDLERL